MPEPPQRSQRRKTPAPQQTSPEPQTPQTPTPQQQRLQPYPPTPESYPSTPEPSASTSEPSTPTPEPSPPPSEASLPPLTHRGPRVPRLLSPPPEPGKFSLLAGMLPYLSWSDLTSLAASSPEMNKEMLNLRAMRWIALGQRWDAPGTGTVQVIEWRKEKCRTLFPSHFFAACLQLTAYATMLRDLRLGKVEVVSGSKAIALNRHWIWKGHKYLFYWSGRNAYFFDVPTHRFLHLRMDDPQEGVALIERTEPASNLHPRACVALDDMVLNVDKMGPNLFETFHLESKRVRHGREVVTPARVQVVPGSSVVDMEGDEHVGGIMYEFIETLRLGNETYCVVLNQHVSCKKIFVARLEREKRWKIVQAMKTEDYFYCGPFHRIVSHRPDHRPAFAAVNSWPHPDRSEPEPPPFENPLFILSVFTLHEREPKVRRNEITVVDTERLWILHGLDVTREGDVVALASHAPAVDEEVQSASTEFRELVYFPRSGSSEEQTTSSDMTILSKLKFNGQRMRKWIEFRVLPLAAEVGFDVRLSLGDARVGVTQTGEDGNASLDVFSLERSPSGREATVARLAHVDLPQTSAWGNVRSRQHFSSVLLAANSFLFFVYHPETYPELWCYLASTGELLSKIEVPGLDRLVRGKSQQPSLLMCDEVQAVVGGFEEEYPAKHEEEGKCRMYFYVVRWF